MKVKANLIQLLQKDGVDSDLLNQAQAYASDASGLTQELVARIPTPECPYYGREIWEAAIAALDEINMAKNEALAVLHSVLDHRRVIDVPGYERLQLHPATRFIATMNYGYEGTRELNEALASRFLVIAMPIISEENLCRVLEGSFPTIRKSWRDQFVKLFYELNDKAEHAEISERAVDLRGLQDAIGLMQLGISIRTALDMGIINKCFDPHEQQLIRDVITARIPDRGGREVFD